MPLLLYWLGGTAAFLLLWRRSLWRVMLLGGLLVLPVLLVKPLIASDFFVLLAAGKGIWPFFLSRAVGGFLSGAVFAGVYELTLHPFFSPSEHPLRQKLKWLAVGLAVFCLLRLGLDVNLTWSLVVSLLMNALIILVWERSLLWDMIFSSMGMGILYLVVIILTMSGLPGDLNNFWIVEKTLGITVFSLPVEEVIVIVLFGALFGPVLVGLKDGAALEGSDNYHHSPSKKFAAFIILGSLTFFGLVTINQLMFIPRVTAVMSGDDVAAHPRTSPVVIHFNRPVERDTLSLDFDPPIDGHLGFEDAVVGGRLYKTAVFTPDSEFLPSQHYRGIVTHIANVLGRGDASYTFEFTTEVASEEVIEAVPTPAPDTPAVSPSPTPTAVPTPSPAPTVSASPKAATAPSVLATPTVPSFTLNVPLDYQDKALSCEIAALKMALAYRGVKVSESDIFAVVGFDPTIHEGNIWGDPDVAFVGDVNGRQNTTGYGVHWDPIARAANQWRPAKAFSKGTLSYIAQEVQNGNPVVLWGVYPTGSYYSPWVTPTGKEVPAWKGEHARTLIGYKGTVEKPTHFIINDPISGRLTWTASQLAADWAKFDNSGVVVY